MKSESGPSGNLVAPDAAPKDWPSHEDVLSRAEKSQQPRKCPVKPTALKSEEAVKSGEKADEAMSPEEEGDEKF